MRKKFCEGAFFMENFVDKSKKSDGKIEKMENEFLGSALSNSRPKYPVVARKIFLTDFKVSIDRLTIVADLSVEAFENAVREWRKLPFFAESGGGFQILDFSNCDVDDFGNKHEHVDPEQIAYLEKPKFLKDKIRIDFNPNHGMNSEGGRWLLKEVISKLPEKHFSRCDIAFDVMNRPEIAEYQVWRWGMTKKYFIGQSGKIETIYFGARSSRQQIRLYNKKVEQEKRHGRIVNLESLWRLEMQLRGNKIEMYPELVQQMLENFYRPAWEDAKDPRTRFAIYGLMHEPTFYNRAPKRTQQRYRKIIKEAKPKNNLSEEMAKAFVEQFASLEFTLQNMMQRFHIDAKEK